MFTNVRLQGDYEEMQLKSAAINERDIALAQGNQEVTRQAGATQPYVTVPRMSPFPRLSLHTILSHIYFVAKLTNYTTRIDVIHLIIQVCRYSRVQIQRIHC